MNGEQDNMLYKVFYDREKGTVYASYTLREEAEGEELETRRLLAYERGIDPAQIAVRIEDSPRTWAELGTDPKQTAV